MARTTKRRSADKDDPIYKGGSVISSMKSTETSNQDSTQTPQADSSTATTGQFKKYRVVDESRLRELGLWGNDELVISTRPSNKPKTSSDIDGQSTKPSTPPTKDPAP